MVKSIYFKKIKLIKIENTNLKYLFLFLLLAFSQLLFSQENKFGLTIEYVSGLSGLTKGGEIDRLKYSHNAILRVSYNAKCNVNPTLGLGFLNTGGIQFKDFSRELFQGQVEIENIHNYNYVCIPIGAKINFSKFYLLPEIGLGINVSNRIKQISTYPIVSEERHIQKINLDSEEFNSLTIPVMLSVGTDFNVGDCSFSAGLKGYYGLNQVAKDQLRNDHYFGLGLVLAINL